MKKIYPSLLAFNKNKMQDQLKKCALNQIEAIHYDVMDINYVNNLAFKEEFIDLIKNQKMEINVHLMTKNVVKNVLFYLNQSVDGIAIHIDADVISNIHYAIDLINQNKTIYSGLAIKCYENIYELISLLKKVKFVIMMGVAPGFGGQKYKPYTTNQLVVLNKIKQKYNLNFQIILDGGVVPDVIKLTKDYVDIFVIGTFLMKADNFNETYKYLKKLIV